MTIDTKRIFDIHKYLQENYEGYGLYNYTDYDDFLLYYCFRVTEDGVMVFNYDPIPYEDYDNDEEFTISFEVIDGQTSLEDYVKLLNYTDEHMEKLRKQARIFSLEAQLKALKND